MTRKPLINASGERIACEARAAAPGTRRAGVVWLGGFKSSMDGAKAAALDRWAARQGRSCVRFDYSGHGRSGGDFGDGTIGKWLGEARLVLDRLTEGPQILVGSSMGGWLALLLAREHRWRGESRIQGLVLIAPAVDMTERLVWNAIGDAARAQIKETGVYMRPSAYGDGHYPITGAFIEEGRDHLLLDAPIDAGCPVRIMQGMNDPDVPWRHALAVMDRLTGAGAALTLIGDGDHRLSRKGDIARMLGLIGELG